jgi:hypothetical protein
MSKHTKIIAVHRSVLEATAHVIGPSSAAARALAAADEHNGESSFFRCGTVILVQMKNTNRQIICS